MKTAIMRAGALRSLLLATWLLIQTPTDGCVKERGSYFALAAGGGDGSTKSVLMPTRSRNAILTGLSKKPQEAIDVTRTVKLDANGDGFEIRIDGLSTHYKLERIETDCDDVDNPAWRLTSEAGDVYVVHQDQWAINCTCPDAVYRRQNAPKPCKHGAALLALGMLKALPVYEGGE